MILVKLPEFTVKHIEMLIRKIVTDLNRNYHEYFITLFISSSLDNSESTLKKVLLL